MKPVHDSIRGWFAAALHEAMEQDERIWLLTGDLGFSMLDKIRDDFPDRYKNVGASEQLLLGAGIGLALQGKIPFCYSITSFLVFRPLEWTRNYLHYENIPVRLIGSGLDDDYKHDGFTHHSFDVKEVLKLLWRIETYYPSDKTEIPALVRKMIDEPKPSFLCLRR